MTNRYTLLERLAEDVNAPELRSPLCWKWISQTWRNSISGKK